MTLPSVDAGQSSAGWHRLQLFIECPRKFGYKEIIGLLPMIQSSPLALGSATHEGLAAHYLGRPFEEGLKDAPKRWAYKVPIARSILQAYVKHYLREPFEVIDVERELIVRINKRKFTRRVDLIFLQQGKIYIMDHKTAGQPKSRFASAQHEAALFTQDLVGRAVIPGIYGKEFGGVVLNVIGSGEPFEFIRRPLLFPPEIIKNAVTSLDYWLSQSESLIQSGMSPWEYPQSWSCQGRYSRCDFWSLCKRGRSAAESLYEYKEAA